MITGDLADSALASEWPDIAAQCDSLSDRLREALAPFISRDQWSTAFAALECVLDQSDSPSVTTASERAQIIVEALHQIYGDTRHEPDIRIIAKSGLIALSKAPESYQAAADEFGVTRACVHAHARRVEDRTGIRPRRAKSDDARQKSVAAAAGRQRERLAPAPQIHKRRRFSLFPGTGIV